MTVVRQIPADSPAALRLVRAMVDDVRAVYDGFGHRAGPSASPAEMSPPGGAFLALYDEDGEAIAGGGIKRLDARTAEIKRMYVVPERRGQGLARALLLALEDAARGLGYERVRLDTGPKQPYARALYLSAGYSELPDYNGNPYASFWGEKTL